MTFAWGTFGRFVFVCCRRIDCGGMCSRLCVGLFAPCAVDCGRSTECRRRCATAQRRHAEAVSRQAPEVQERLSFAYFSLPLQRKVGAAPHRGNAYRPTRKRGCQHSKKPKKPNTDNWRRRQKKPLNSHIFHPNTINCQNESLSKAR